MDSAGWRVKGLVCRYQYKGDLLFLQIYLENKLRVYIAREAQLVEQSIEAALVVSSSLISSKLSYSYFSVCDTDFLLTAAKPP